MSTNGDEHDNGEEDDGKDSDPRFLYKAQISDTPDEDPREDDDEE